jgi:hypothetical protein
VWSDILKVFDVPVCGTYFVMSAKVVKFIEMCFMGKEVFQKSSSVFKYGLFYIAKGDLGGHGAGKTIYKKIN